MPREDETYRNIRYGGHPPTCTCVDCVKRRKRRIENKGSSRAIYIAGAIIIIIVILIIIITITVF